MTTPPTNRPMTGEDWIAATEIPSDAPDLIDIKYADGEILHRQERLGGYRGDDIIAYRVSRPAPEPERDGAVERVRRMVGGECDATVYEGHAKARLEAFDADLRHVLSLLETAERQRDEAVRALRECRDRLTAFVGAVAEVTDCSADVEAIKRADAVISKSGDA